MSCAQKFHNLRNSSPVLALTGLLALTSMLPFSNATAQEPDVKPTTPAVASPFSHTAPVTPGKNLTPPTVREITPVEGATQFSKRGVGLYLLLKEGESLEKYKPGLARLMEDLKKSGVPAKIFGDVTGKHDTQIFGIVDGVTYGRTDYAGYGDGYRMNQLGKMASDVISAYQMLAMQRQIDAIDDTIKSNNERILRNTQKIQEIQSFRDRLGTYMDGLYEGRIPEHNRDGSFKDQEFERKVKEYETRNGNKIDYNDPNALLRAINDIYKNEEVRKKTGR